MILAYCDHVGNCMNIYAGATQHHHRTQAVFNQSEDYGNCFIVDNYNGTIQL